jgi:hypothetical protein
MTKISDPNQHYARLPAANQQNITEAFGSQRQSSYTGTPPAGTASLSNYNTQGQLPGFSGYKLPAQNYATQTLAKISASGSQASSTSVIYTTTNTDYIQGTSSQLEPNRDLKQQRLVNSGLPNGADPYQKLVDNNANLDRRYGNIDDRVYLKDNTGKFTKGVASALAATGGILWPYTPTVTSSHRATYDVQKLTHTPYGVVSYQNSSVESINVTGEFSASSEASAAYVAGVIWFLRMSTKMFYGQDSLRGTPPPIFFLTGHGPVVFENVPVVVTNYEMTLPADVDYISCTVGGNHQRVPTLCSISASMMPVYSRNKITNSYSLEKLAQGGLIGQGFI